MSNKPAVILFACAVAVSAGGAQCMRPLTQPPVIYGPRVLTEHPTTQDVIQVVNANSALIRSLYTTDATMSVPGAPSLRANLALERQKKLRLRAETALTGAEVDMGSNDELFWFWVRRNPPPTLYYCRHDKFATSAAKQIVPVDPEWLLDAIGLVTFDAYHQHSAPQKNRNGKWEVRTTLPDPAGGAPLTKVTVVDDARGFVLEQHMYDSRGTLIASALTSRHWRDPGSGAIVPQVIDINWPSTQFSLKFDVRTWTVNNLQADPKQLFTMPSFPGWAVVDLADPSNRSGGAPAASPVSSPTPISSGVAPNSPTGAGTAPIPTPTPYSTTGGMNAPTGLTAVPDAISSGATGGTTSANPMQATPYAAVGPAAGRDLLGWAPATSPYNQIPSVSSGMGNPAPSYSSIPYSAPTPGTSPFSTAAAGSTSSLRSARNNAPPAAPGMLR